MVYLGLVCLVTFSLGVEFAFVTIPAQTMISEATEPHLRGRVFALLFMVTGTVSAVPAVLIGNLADNLGIVPMLLSLAVLVAVAGLFSFRGGARQGGGRGRPRPRRRPAGRSRPRPAQQAGHGDQERPRHSHGAVLRQQAPVEAPVEVVGEDADQEVEGGEQEGPPEESVQGPVVQAPR